jgi:ribonuclease D
MWRDTAAREEDIPPRAFLRDEVLLDMARQPVKSLDKLDRVKHLPRPVESRYGQELVNLTLEALDHPAPDIRMPKEYEPSPTEKFRGDAVWAAAQAICAARGIDPALVGSRQDLTDFFIGLKSGRPAAEHKLMKGWRFEALGGPLLDLYAGKAAFGFAWVGGRLVNR